MLFTRLLGAALSASTVLAGALADAESLPWANANPYAAAAAVAYADAYAEAVAISHPDPEAYALAASEDDCATIGCHASCGMLIVYGTACSYNTENDYAGPYNTTCLCTDGSKFMNQYPSCMSCGWTLWKYYGGYVSSALAACGTLSTEPTGTLRCSTTLTDSYTIETDLQACEYTGGCPTTTATTSTSTSTTSTSTTSTSKTSTSLASQRDTLTDTTYTATTYTVTTPLSYHFEYTIGGEETDCFTSSATVTNVDIPAIATSWTIKTVDSDTAAKSYKTYYFLNFTEDQTDVADMQLLTGTTMSTAFVRPVAQPDSEFFVNLQQGAYYILTTNYTNPLAYGYAILVTKTDGTKILYSYSCSTTRLTLTYMDYKGGFDQCATTYAGYYYEQVCVHQNETNVDIIFRPDAAVLSSSAVESSTYAIESSSAVESTIESSSEAPSSTIASSSAVESSAASSSSAVEFSSAAPSSSVETSAAPSTESSAAESSVEPTSESSAVESSVPVSSATESAVESSAASESATPSSATEPDFSGSLDNGAPNWTLSIPSTVFPWTSITLEVSKEGSVGSFDYTQATISLNGNDVSASAEITVTADSISLTFTSSDVTADAVINFAGAITAGSQWTSNAHLVLSSPDGKKLIKRAEQSWDLSSTITSDAASSGASSEAASSSAVSPASSEAASSSAVPASSSEAVSSSAAGYINGTSTVTEEDISTTIATITSCAASGCVTTTVPTGVTVVTTTSNGVVTEYTTYCPLTTETSAPGTTVITVTSCSEDKCEETAVTTGVTVVKTTTNGVITEYTTYCPLTSESPKTNTEESTTTKAASGTAQDLTSTETKQVTSVVTPATSDSTEASTEASLSTFEGVAAKVMGTGAFGLIAGLLFI